MGAADPQPAEAVRQLMPVSQLLLAEVAARQGLFWPGNYCLRFRPSLNLLRSSLPVVSLGGVTCLAVAVAAAWRTRRP